MIPLKSNYFLVLALVLLVLTSFTERTPVRGEFRYGMWVGPHGHYGRINIRGAHFTKRHWSSNFFHPTQVMVWGRISFTGDSITFTPRGMSFYRRLEGDSKRDFQKITCACDAKGLRDIDRDKEWYVITSCESSNYFLRGDTLIDHGGHFKYIRYQKEDED